MAASQITQVAALDAGDITKVGVIITIVLVLIIVLLAIVVRALIGRLVLIVIGLVLIAFVWQQRSHVQDRINKDACDLKATFFGIHLDAPDSVRQDCRQHAKV